MELTHDAQSRQMRSTRKQIGRALISLNTSSGSVFDETDQSVLVVDPQVNVDNFEQSSVNILELGDKNDDEQSNNISSPNLLEMKSPTKDNVFKTPQRITRSAKKASVTSSTKSLDVAQVKMKLMERGFETEPKRGHADSKTTPKRDQVKRIKLDLEDVGVGVESVNDSVVTSQNESFDEKNATLNESSVSVKSVTQVKEDSFITPNKFLSKIPVACSSKTVTKPENKRLNITRGCNSEPRVTVSLCLFF